ncbi:phosphatidate cytidylyltransferase [Demequina sp. NBRC 110056]|uniref:phosphatidate cytidylyltransferase n=1 Tax=Demequina sp. NBRC 110056 TaxID=1570345 RepID=UPI000A011485|nr:phosphatidate cytidylyltransferase [Demequina sp. NBRC 110056]
MSIFRRRAGAQPEQEPDALRSASSVPDAAWLPVSAPEPASPVEAGTLADPAPYYAPGMPSLHPQDAATSAQAPAVADPASASAHPGTGPASASAPSTPSEPAAPTWSAIHGDGGAEAAQRDATRLAVVGDASDEEEAVDDVRVDPATIRSVEQPVPQIAPVSRSGRNMTVATVVGLALLGLVVVAAWWNPLAFALLAGAACIAAAYEWRSVLAKHERRVPLIPVTIVTGGLIIATWFGGPEGLVVALMVGLAGTVAWRVVDERIENTLADSLASMLTILWIPFLGSFLVLLELAGDGWQRVLVVILAVVGSDTGGLFAGMLLGKHPMAPRVSPKKTWEGFAGGLLLGTAAASVAAYFFFDGQWWVGALVGVACALAAVLGDLAESAIKRDIQVKDMSSFLPGHGGIMDRVDSLLLAAPVAYVVFGLLLGVS